MRLQPQTVVDVLFFYTLVLFGGVINLSQILGGSNPSALSSLALVFYLLALFLSFASDGKDRLSCVIPDYRGPSLRTGHQLKILRGPEPSRPYSPRIDVPGIVVSTDCTRHGCMASVQT